MAETMNFTKADIEALAPPASGRREVKDVKTAGLYLRVTPKNVKTFSYLGRPKGSSRVERLTIGKFPAVTVDQARKTVLQIAGQLATGKSVADSARDLRGEMTLDELSSKYLAFLSEHTRRPDGFALHYRLYIAPQFGTRRLSEIKAPDVTRWLRAMPGEILRKRAAKEAERLSKHAQARLAVEKRQALQGRKRGPTPAPKKAPLSAGRVTGMPTANKAYESLRAMFNWAMSADGEHCFAGPNPAASQRSYKTSSRERFLQPEEMEAFFKSLAAEENFEARDCTVIKLLTGVRRSNVQAMTWAQINWSQAVWQIPMTKNGKPLAVVLAPEAYALLEHRFKGRTSTFVFPSPKSKTGHIVNTSKAWRRILERAGLEDLREHDLRRTFDSWLARDGIGMPLIGKSLGQDSISATKIYSRVDLGPVRLAVTRSTSSMFAAAGLGKAGEVIEFPTPSTNQVSGKRGGGGT